MTIDGRTLEQKRAADALSKVREIEQRREAGDELGKNYRSYLESLPATIVMNGLGQACATLLAHAGGNPPQKSAYRLLYDHLQGWLCRRPGGVYGQPELIDAIVHHDQKHYVHAQAEALAYLNWLKKFAQAFLKPPSDSTGGSHHAE